MRRAPPLLLLGAIVLLGGCSPKTDLRHQPRPVKVVRVAESRESATLIYAGEVRSRYETKLAFRVSGKVLSRHVNLGDSIKKGQLVASLDPTDYQLAKQSIAAQLEASRRERDLAKDDLARYRDLLNQNLISAAEYDRRDTAYTSAKNRAEALEAQYRQAEDQLEYTSLRADRDGVVTALFVETDQVLAAGQTVAALAQRSDLEVAINIPEHQISAMRPSQPLKISLWARPDQILPGQVRELSASADPMSRTYSVRVRLKTPPPWVQLGMTANVLVHGAAPEGPVIPLAALFRPRAGANATKIWIVDERTGKVRSSGISVLGLVKDQQVCVAGVDAGQLVVVAGVNRLEEGQEVRILGERDLPSSEARALPLRAR